MGIKLVDTLESMGNFPVANASGIQFSDGEDLQKKFDDGSLGGGAEAYTELSQEEYDALSDDEKSSGTEYRTYDTGRIYKYGVLYGGKEPVETTWEDYKQLKADGLVDPNTDYIVKSDENGILLGSNDIGHGDGTVKTKFDALDNDKIDKNFVDGLTDANEAVGKAGVNLFIMSYASENLPIARTGVIRSFTTISSNYIRVNQEFSTIDESPQNGGTYKRYGSSDDGGVTFTWSTWNFVASIDDSTTALLKTWSSSKIASYVAENAAPTYSGTVIPTKIASGATVTTDWNIASGGDNVDNGRLLLLNSSAGTFLIHVKGNLGNTSTISTPTVVSSIATSQSGTWSSSFELSISSGKLRIKNKSGAVASWRFI
jgi:hypothetical protein